MLCFGGPNNLAVIIVHGWIHSLCDGTLCQRSLEVQHQASTSLGTRPAMARSRRSHSPSLQAPAFPTDFSGMHCQAVREMGASSQREVGTEGPCWASCSTLSRWAGLPHARPMMKQETFSCGALSLSLPNPGSGRNWNLTHRRLRPDSSAQ